MRDKIARAVAWLLPRRVAYWCAVRLGAHATTGDYGHEIVPELRFMDALERWDRPFRPPPGAVRVVVVNNAPRVS